MHIEAKPQDWQPADDLRARLVFYKADMKALFGYARRTVELKVSMGEFPHPDHYDGKRAVWTRETVMNHVKSMRKDHSAPPRFGFQRKTA